jgi:hypothetical protein
LFDYLCGITYRQYTDHIKLCAYLGKEPQGEFKDFYDFITGLWKDMEFTVINEHNKQGIIYYKGTDFYMEQDFKNGWLWCRLDWIWSFFQIKKGMEYTETQDFIQRMVEEHLKYKVSTPTWKDFQAWNKVEEHLKCKVNTTLNTTLSTPAERLPSTTAQVEEHF